MRILGGPAISDAYYITHSFGRLVLWYRYYRFESLAITPGHTDWTRPNRFRLRYNRYRRDRLITLHHLDHIQQTTSSARRGATHSLGLVVDIEDMFESILSDNPVDNLASALSNDGPTFEQ